jgi:hypothetical protein
MGPVVRGLVWHEEALKGGKNETGVELGGSQNLAVALFGDGRRGS